MFGLLFFSVLLPVLAFIAGTAAGIWIGYLRGYHACWRQVGHRILGGGHERPEPTV